MIGANGANSRAATVFAAITPLALLLVTRAVVELANPAVTLAHDDVDSSAEREIRSSLVAGEQAVLARRHADSLYALRIDCPFVDHSAQTAELGDTGPSRPPTFDPEDGRIPFPSIHVTSIIGGRAPLAIIDGRTLRPGDVVAPGWKLTAIVARERRVVIADRSGRTRSVTISR